MAVHQPNNDPLKIALNLSTREEPVIVTVAALCGGSCTIIIA